MSDPSGFNAWLQRNRTAVIIGGAVAVLLVVAGGASTNSGGTEPTDCGQASATCLPEQSGGDGTGGGVPGGDGSGTGGGVPSGDGGGFDMDEWRRRQAEDDERQRERIRTIREEEKCAREDGGNDVVSIHTGC